MCWPLRSSQNRRAICLGVGSWGGKSRGGRSHGSNSMEQIRGHEDVEKITANLVRTVESERGIHACQGRFHIYTAFYASFGFDYVEWFPESTLNVRSFWMP